MSVMRVILRHPNTKFEVRRPFCLEDMAYFRSRVKWPGDLSTFKWDHGLPCRGLPLYQNLSLARLSILDVGSDM